MMGMTGMFKWLKKDTIQRDRSRQSLPPKFSFNNNADRNGIHAFFARRRNPTDPGYIVSLNSTDTSGFDFFIKNNCDNENNKDKVENCDIPICGVPHVQPAEIFEIGSVAGTEDRFIELIYAEWQNTKVSLRKHIHRVCAGAVKNDIKVLSEVRHPNVLLLMGTTQTFDNNLVAIFEPVDCTLYHFIHEQSERIPIQGIAKCTGSLAAALKYAHMRGYIHTAISSHCVFLTSSGVVKLGGWELAIESYKPLMEVKKYEDRLRSEIIRWQAPELFSGHKPTVATDVYGLTLLMWELCTTSIPWADLTKEEIEKQYLQCKKRISIEAYNFPSLLNNLLEVGLQLDMNKRNLDMMMMTRFLQRLEMQYEDKEPIYINPQSFNQTDYQDSTRLSCISHATSMSQDSLTVQLPRISSDSPDENTKQSPIQRRSYDRKKIEPRKLFPKTRLLNRSLDSTNIRNIDLMNKMSKINEKKISEFKEKSATINTYELTAKNDNEAKDPLTQEVISNPRIDIKKLKEVLANRRRNFFYSNGSSSNPIHQEKNKSEKISTINAIKSKDSGPHKPASHTIGIEPKSPGQYSTYTKSSPRKTPKSTYSYMPVPIRNAVIQPQVLNSSSQSFFESSLWSKEKSMCLSKSQMNDSELYENKSSVSPGSDKTFTISTPVDNLRDASNKFTPMTDLTTDVTMDAIPKSQSLQALKDTLERVTNLVKLNSSNASNETSFLTSAVKNSEILNNTNNDAMKLSESLFEELYDLNENIDDKIKTIERSSSQRYFTVDLKKTHGGNEELSTEKTNPNRLSNCSIQAKQNPTLVELKTALECGLPIARSTKEYTIERKIETKAPAMDTMTDAPIRFMIDSEDDRNLDFLDANNKIDANKYASYSEVILGRRRSFPSGLGEFKCITDMTFGKLSNKNAGIPDNTVEDFYIDDEFDEYGLAPNMILLDKDSTAGSNFFSDVTEEYENILL